MTGAEGNLIVEGLSRPGQVPTLCAYRHLQAGQPEAERRGPTAGVALIIISDDPSLRGLLPSACYCDIR